MFLKFLFFATLITAGAVENEGGREAIQEKGFKAAVQDAWDQREPVDYTKLND